MYLKNFHAELYRLLSKEKQCDEMPHENRR
jgi:hypothetical protein